MSDAIDELNHVSPVDFIATLAGIYEHSPWVAEQVARYRPFETIVALAEAMQAVVRNAASDDQLRLLRAHPELGQAGRLTDHSTSEQNFAGFDQLTPARADQLSALNQRYRDNFGFPFIVAVRAQKDARTIIAQLERRLANDHQTEIATALDEVGRIAWFRLQRLHQPAR
jgi:2-oxo-4-hydroxy-4-carboxy-5-ureidoimidazoline decarboxylase